MRRATIIGVLALAFALGAWQAANGQPLNYLTRAAMQAGTWTWAHMQTFTSGLTANGAITANAGASIASGQKLYLNGSTNTTYLTWDADTACIQQWRNGTLVRQTCAGYEVSQDCPTDTSSLPFGGMCKNQATGEVLLKTGSGLIALTGSAR
jgi:hypothetical protein